VNILEFFKASTQYGDWEGTAKADDQPKSLHTYLEEKGLIGKDEFLLAATIYIGEHSFDSPYIKAFVFEKGSEYGSVKAQIESTKDPIPVRQVDVSLTAEEFFELFKRFDVMLTWHGLELEGRGYVVS
jgi:hypothetical protein